MNEDFAVAVPGDGALAARIRSYEMAARMQASVPETLNVDREPEAVKRMYGMDVAASEGFGRNCLLARRLLERGVRFVQLFNGGAFGSPRLHCAAHEDLIDNHKTHAATM